MTIYSDTFHWWDISPIFDPLLIWTLLPNLTFHLIVWGFHWTFATGAACQQRTLTPPDTWSCPTLGLACVLMLRPISLELVLFPDFWASNIPRYFCFAFYLYFIAIKSVHRTTCHEDKNTLLKWIRHFYFRDTSIILASGHLCWPYTWSTITRDASQVQVIVDPKYR